MMRMRQPVYKSILEHSNVVLTNSQFTKGYLDKVLEAETSVLHPPVEAKEITSAAKSVDERMNTVLTISHIRRDKRLELVSEIAKKVEDAEFRVIGHIHDVDYHGELLSATEDLGVESRVSFETGLDRRGLMRSLMEAKVYLHTMHYEHFGISIVEAMASGLVPVVPRSGGPYVDVLNGSQGIYGYSYSNVQEAADCIRRLLGDERLRTGCSVKSIQRSHVFDSSVFRAKFTSYVNHMLERSC